jgi:two-component system, OmpR family, response regulator
MRILLIEDDIDTADTIREELDTEYIMDLSAKGSEGENLLRVNDYDLVIIDINLPDKNGIDVCRTIRAEGYRVPILMLTGDNIPQKKVLALDTGADDYLTKPFNFPELKARIRSLLRRTSETQKTSTLMVGNLSLDLEKRLVMRDGKSIHLGRKETAILEYLMRNAGRVLTRDMIFNHVWNSMTEPLYNTVDVHIKYLRDRIDRKFDKQLIQTVYGLGYKIEV